MQRHQIEGAKVADWGCWLSWLTEVAE
jgi:hypothetical protein